MTNAPFAERIQAADAAYATQDPSLFALPTYDPSTHYLELTRSGYFKALLTLRHYIRAASDTYFSIDQGATNLDLFMMTPSVSSPMGPGSDSETVPVTFGKLHTYLVDSSQFGFEPVLMNGLQKVYCYLPSMRGEDPDKRHLNQFFHCEAEIKGGREELLSVIEGYIRAMCNTLMHMPNIVERISKDPHATNAAIKRIAASTSFQRISFDEAIELLRKSGIPGLFTESEHGRDMNSRGELELMRILGTDMPLWVTSYDRDRVAFYQKPDPANPNAVLNADLLFPPLIEGAFWGEVVGCGQRQDTPEEMYESLKRQGISPDPYEWYINLRRQPSYSTTSGFGLGIERFITWALCRDDIKDAIPYPRLKNIVTYP
jgi:asparaginyl-tRNA synthetase